MNYPTPGDDYIDGQDVYVAVEALQDDLKTFEEAVEKAEEALKEIEESLQELALDLKAAETDEENASKDDDLELLTAEAERVGEAIKNKTEEYEDAQADLEQARKDLQEWHEENDATLEQLADLAYEIDRYETLIHEDKFTEYVQELLEDMGLKIPDYVVVDWEATAKNIQQDYTAVEFGGETYYFRS